MLSYHPERERERERERQKKKNGISPEQVSHGSKRVIF
jgi:hypothetical protein